MTFALLSETCSCFIIQIVAIVFLQIIRNSNSISFVNRRKPEGFDEQCDIIFNIAVQAKDVRCTDLSVEV